MGFMNWLMKGAGFETEEVYDNTLEKNKKKEEKMMLQEEKRKMKAEAKALKAQKKADKVAKKYSLDMPAEPKQDVSDQPSTPSFYSENPSSYSNMSSAPKYDATINDYSSKSNNVGGYGTKNVEFISPTRYEDVVIVIRYLKEGESIMLNLSKMNTSESQRLLDCAYGAMYALNGNIKQVDNNIFFITPEGFNIKTPTNYGDNYQQ